MATNKPLPGEDTVLNRDNKQILEKVDGSEFDTAVWIINPDLSAVVGKDPKFWKIVADQVLPLSDIEADTDAELVEEARVAKVNQINAIAESALQGDFMSSATGAPLTYQATLSSRLELTEGILTGGDATINSVSHTHDQLLAVLGDFAKEKGQTTQKQQDLLTQAANATTVSEIEAIIWS